MFPADPAALPQEPGSHSPFPAPASGTPGPGTVSPGAAADAPASGWQPAEGGPPAPPSVSLPKGGGAIRDIGEKFSVTAATGTASLTIPVTTSPGRAGFGPSLSLSYDSGAGNGPFGLGWKMALPIKSDSDCDHTGFSISLRRRMNVSWWHPMPCYPNPGSGCGEREA